MGRLLNYLGLAADYVVLNLRAHMEYRASFYWQIGSMFVNNCMWVAFWAIFFTRFPVLRGWTVDDVITIWALAATGFGLAHAIYGNASVLATVIAQGQLDAWMLYPRALLSHMLLGRMSASAWGDALFGYVIFVLFVQPDLARFGLFVLLSLSVALLFVGFSVATGSLSFFLGNATELATQWRMSMLTFSTYPSVLFDGGVRVLLFTLVPTMFVTHFPVLALRDLSLWNALLAFMGALTMLLIAVVVFYAGLRRYESGNLMEMRG